MPNPACTVNGSAAPQDVTASSSVTIALADSTGANFWSLSCTSADDTTSPATINASLVIDSVHKTATFNAVGLGTAYIFTSIVGVRGLQLDANSVKQDAYKTTFKVNVLTGSGKRVVAVNEELEQDAVSGWVKVINAAIRSL